ncbi:MAG: nitronate monooxygenase, partial [Gemmatimonadetes bacterium]|nr:nitronate monooxygenase [Gemmatimonadota bacterium]
MTAATVTHPLIIQGGMGVGVSNWVLAKAVSLRGHLGVVSGTCVDSLLVRRLQDGDIGGHVRRAMAAFPLPDVSGDVLMKYFLPEGRAPGEPYKEIPMYRQVVTRVREQLTVLASFVEVWLAKEGHDGVVGINLLTKVQMPNLATLYGAMLAGVDYVLMGAGIPKEIPGVLDR